MGQLAISSIYLKKEFTPPDSQTISQLLKISCETIRETKKGRHWEVRGGDNSQVSLSIHVHRTANSSSQIEEEMNRLGLTTANYPEVIQIVSLMGREVDLKYCQSVGELIGSSFNCEFVNAQLIS